MLMDFLIPKFSLTCIGRFTSRMQIILGWIAAIIAGSLEAAYSLNWGARDIWGKGGGETLALLW